MQPYLPEPGPVSRPFWDGLREHRLVLQYSPSNEQFVFYPRILAPGTLADDLEWRQVSGEAVLYTFTVARRPTAPAWADRVPQLIAVVELIEGVRLTSELVGVQPEEIRIGMRLRAVYDDAADDVTLLRFAPA